MKKQRKWLALILAIVLVFNSSVFIQPLAYLGESKRLDEALLSHLETLNDSDICSIVIWWLDDVNHKQIQENAIKKIVSKSEERSIDIDAIKTSQEFIEEKRLIARTAYTAFNEAKLEEIPALNIRKNDDLPKVFFVSKYSPIVKIQATKQQILELANEEIIDQIYLDVQTLEEEPINGDIESIISAGNSLSSRVVNSVAVWQGATNAKYIRDTIGLTGSGVKVGIMDSEPLRLSDSGMASYRSLFTDLGSRLIVDSNARAETDYSHVATVAAIIAGSTSSYKGIAPGVTLYSTTANRVGTTGLNLQAGIEWLLTKGVNVISTSVTIGDSASRYNSYGLIGRWYDHIAIQHDVNVVIASGNEGAGRIHENDFSLNAILVGRCNPNATTARGNDTMDTSISSYSTNTRLPNKPDLCAPGDDLTIPLMGTMNGTSFSAPMVAAVIAQLCQENSILKTNNALTKAVILAGINSCGALQSTTPKNTSSLAMQLAAGAGELDSKAARYIVQAGRYRADTLTSGVSTKTYTFTVSSSDTLTRVCLAWLTNVRVTGTHADATPTSPGYANLNLTVTDPNGNTYSSKSNYGNVELVSFSPTVYGTYTIKIQCVSRPSSEPSVHYGLAYY